jgi:DNA-binding PadR family transcriptional regulator
MSLRHALLGLLAERPASGWDLARRFEEVLGAVWPAGHPQIYGELRKLRDDGLIEVESEGPRGRTTYRTTDAGLAEVRAWLNSAEVDHTIRLESLLRSVFFWLMTPEELADHLDREADYFRRAAAQYRALAGAKDRGRGRHQDHRDACRLGGLGQGSAAWVAGRAAGRRRVAAARKSHGPRPGRARTRSADRGKHRPSDTVSVW